MHDQPATGLSIRAHRGVVIFAAMVGFFGGAAAGALLFEEIGAMAGCAVGSMVLMQLVRLVLPAICPECGRRAHVRFVTSSSPTDSDTGISIEYHCVSCGYEDPRRLATKADFTQFGETAARFAVFVRAIFTVIGGLVIIGAGSIAVTNLLNAEFRNLGIALGVMAFGIAWLFLARFMISTFIRRATQMMQSMAAQAPLGNFEPFDSVADGIAFRAESLASGHIEISMDLPQRQLHLSSQLFDTNDFPFDRAAADWGAKPFQTLFNLGATLVDVASRGDGLRVQIPRDRVHVTRQLVHLAATQMAALRRLALGEPE